jgi:probable F420-dependent oxidoreductase
MRFGIQHGVGDPNWQPAILAPDAVRRFATTAERVGYDAIAFTDHPAPSVAWVNNGGEGVADWAGSLGFCAAVTERIRLLTFVMVPSYRNPLLAAHQLATLDALSGGRLIVGLGTGYLFSEMRALGGDPAHRRETFDESIEIMRQAWTGQPVAAATATFSAKAAIVHPPVVQTPHPPLWIHGNGPWGTERAAQYGHGWMGMITGSNDELAATTRTTPIRDVAELGQRIRAFRSAVERHGRDPATLDVVAMGGWPYFDVRQPWSAEQLRDDVGRMADVGVDWVILTCCGDDASVSVESIEAFAADVIGPSS